MPRERDQSKGRFNRNNGIMSWLAGLHGGVLSGRLWAKIHLFLGLEYDSGVNFDLKK